MRKLLMFVFLICAAQAAHAQGIRFSSQVTQKTSVSALGLTNVVTVPTAPVIAFCNAPANGTPCTNKATTYTDATLVTPCSTSTQIVLDGTNSCVAAPDAQNNWGVWVAPNAAGYAYTVTIAGVNFGPFYVLQQTTTGLTLNPANVNGFIYVDGVKYPTLASALTACQGTAGCTIYDNAPETFNANPFSGFTSSARVVLGFGVWTTNVNITVPNTSVLEGPTFRGNDQNSPTYGATIKAGASFPINTPVVTMTGTQGNVVTKLQVDCNGVAGSTGIFATDIQEKGGVREILTTNCVKYGVNVDASLFSVIPAQNYFLQNIECFPNATGTFGTASTDCVHLKGNGGGGPGPVAQITGSGSVGHVIGNTLSVENFNQGIATEIHGENVTNVISMLNAGVTQFTVDEATTASACTDLIHIPNTVTGNTWTFINLGKGVCTNIVNDMPDGITDTATTEALFLVGPGAIGSREIYATSNGVFKVIVGGPTFQGSVVNNAQSYWVEGTCTAGAATKDSLCASSALHALELSNNNGVFAQVATVTATPLSVGSGTGNVFVAPNGYFVCTAACTVTPPLPTAGVKFCVLNDNNVATIITLGALGGSGQYGNTANTAYGTAGTGTFTSAGAVTDQICILGRDATHYLTQSFIGTWTAH